MRWWFLILCCLRPAFAAPLLPTCGPGLDGQVSESGCRCRDEQASLLSAQPAGWRWSCDLLRGGSSGASSLDSSQVPQASMPDAVWAQPEREFNPAY